MFLRVLVFIYLNESSFNQYSEIESTFWWILFSIRILEKWLIQSCSFIVYYNYLIYILRIDLTKLIFEYLSCYSCIYYKNYN